VLSQVTGVDPASAEENEDKEKEAGGHGAVIIIVVLVILVAVAATVYFVVLPARKELGANAELSTPRDS
jgi:flagellar basal body-associated protein FliL